MVDQENVIGDKVNVKENRMTAWCGAYVLPIQQYDEIIVILYDVPLKFILEWGLPLNLK